MSPTERARAPFAVIVPVKPPAFAKSRLGRLGEQVRRDLAAAFAVDTVEAVRAAELVAVVLAVTDDHELAGLLRELGAQVMPDGTVDDLNAVLVQAAAELARRSPSLRPVALCADLPALRPVELDLALEAALQHELSFVADADGVGTTLFAAEDLEGFRPRFGPGSRSWHLGAGAKEIDLAGIDSLRRDVDTPDDLAAAMRLGIGARTSRLTADLL